MNAISDVVQNRPLPLRDFDQIFMKAGDMVMQSEFVAHWSRGQRLAFMGDGDAISVCVGHLQAKGILEYGPSEIVVYDFDERIVQAIESFAAEMKIGNLTAKLYNCVEPIPDLGRYDLFYTNPPWGKNNGGASISVFVQRGMELVTRPGGGLVVLADRHPERDWTGRVLANVQGFAVDQGFYVARMMPDMHSYHLDDDPVLRSCNLILSSSPGTTAPTTSERIVDPSRLDDFYKRGGGPPTVRYVRSTRSRELRTALDEEYVLELFEEET